MFDYIVTADNAIGKCDLAFLLRFAMSMSSRCFRHGSIIRADKSVGSRARSSNGRWCCCLLLSICWHHLLCVALLLVSDAVRRRADIESNILFGDISYSHFCHRAFFDQHWKGIGAHAGGNGEMAGSPIHSLASLGFIGG